MPAFIRMVIFLSCALLLPFVSPFLSYAAADVPPLSTRQPKHQPNLAPHLFVPVISRRNGVDVQARLYPSSDVNAEPLSEDSASSVISELEALLLEIRQELESLAAGLPGPDTPERQFFEELVGIQREFLEDLEKNLQNLLDTAKSGEWGDFLEDVATVKDLLYDAGLIPSGFDAADESLESHQSLQDIKPSLKPTSNISHPEGPVASQEPAQLDERPQIEELPLSEVATTEIPHTNFSTPLVTTLDNAEESRRMTTLIGFLSDFNDNETQQSLVSRGVSQNGTVSDPNDQITAALEDITDTLNAALLRMRLFLSLVENLVPGEPGDILTKMVREIITGLTWLLEQLRTGNLIPVWEFFMNLPPLQDPNAEHHVPGNGPESVEAAILRELQLGANYILEALRQGNLVEIWKICGALPPLESGSMHNTTLVEELENAGEHEDQSNGTVSLTRNFRASANKNVQTMQLVDFLPLLGVSMGLDQLSQMTSTVGNNLGNSIGETVGSTIGSGIGDLSETVSGTLAGILSGALSGGIVELQKYVEAVLVNPISNATVSLTTALDTAIKDAIGATEPPISDSANISDVVANAWQSMGGILSDWWGNRRRSLRKLAPNLQTAVLSRTTNRDVNRLSREGLLPELGAYRPYSYNDINEGFKELAASPQCNSIMKVTTAQKEWGHEVKLDAPWFFCGKDRKCETQIVTMGSNKTDKGTAQIFFSGAVHGDERIGPATLYELAKLLCHMYGKNPIITYLLDNRILVMTPTTNAWGYAHNRRDEYRTDPNRDFPYLKTAKRNCMESITARVLNELFRRNLFQLVVTFHGGTRVMAYEWGSFDHANQKDLENYKKASLTAVHSNESPDLYSQAAIAAHLRAAAGILPNEHPFERRERYGYRRGLRVPEDEVALPNGALSGDGFLAVIPSQPAIPVPGPEDLANLPLDVDPTVLKLSDGHSWFYPTGAMSDLVYPVDGGFEDWSYSASWQDSPEPITICNPSLNGGYPAERTVYNTTNGLRASTFLVETDYFKAPPLWQLGNALEVVFPGPLDGHVSRNLRLLLKLIELATPDLLFLAQPTLLASNAAGIRFSNARRLRLGNPKFDKHQNVGETVDKFVAGEPEDSKEGLADLPSNEQEKIAPQYEHDLSLSFLPIGCTTLNYLDAVIMPTNDCSADARQPFLDSQTLSTSNASGTELFVAGARIVLLAPNGSKLYCGGLGLWEDWNVDPVTKKFSTATLRNRQNSLFYKLGLTAAEVANDQCVFFRALFDQTWGHQVVPDPQMPPQTHVARTRLEETYFVSSENAIINTTRIKTFPMVKDDEPEAIHGIRLGHLGTFVRIPFEDSALAPLDVDSANQTADGGAVAPTIQLAKLIFPFQYRSTMGDSVSSPWEISLERELSDHGDYGKLGPLSDWNPFALISSFNETTSKLERFLGESENISIPGAGTSEIVDRIIVSTPMRTLNSLTGPTDFVLRVWDSEDLVSWKTPLDVKKLALWRQSTDSLISEDEKMERRLRKSFSGDGEVLRWTVDRTGRLFRADSNIGFSIRRDLSGASGDTEPTWKLLFSPDPVQGNTPNLKDLQHLGYSLEAIPWVRDGDVSPEGPVAIATSSLQIVTATSDRTVEGQQASNFLCIVTPEISKTFQYIGPSLKVALDWYNEPNALLETLVQKVNGYLLLNYAEGDQGGRNGTGISGEVTGRICGVASGEFPETDVVTLRSRPGAACAGLRLGPVKRGHAGIVTPLRNRYFPISQEISSVFAQCRENDILDVVLRSGAEPSSGGTVIGSCRLIKTNQSAKFYDNSICVPKNQAPVKADAALTSPQKLVIGAAVSSFIVLAILPLRAIITRRRRAAYETLSGPVDR